MIPFEVGNIDGRNYYSGSNNKDKKVIILGIPNQVHENNLKMALHELSHIYLTHCDGNVGELKCAMNTEDMFGDTTDSHLKKRALDFCKDCYKELKN